MKGIIPILTATFLLAAPGLFADDKAADKDKNKDTTSTATGTGTRARATDGDVTYGKVKEFTAGQKIVVAVDNAPDKTFDLNDKDLKSNLDTNLKVGDTVKVTEQSSALGKTTSVTIAKHTGAVPSTTTTPPAARKP